MIFTVTSSLLVSLPFLPAIQAGVIPLPNGYHRYAAPNNSLQWEDCSLDGLPGRECTRFEVPLDWHNEAAGKASLAVIRYPATKQPKLGTVFMNPGGPGGSGLNDVKGAAGDIILQSIGGNYDLVSWDPRGIGKTIPKTACFGSSEEYDTFWNDSFIPTGTEVRGDFTSQTVLDDFYAQLNTSDDLIRRIGEQCVAYSPNVFQYVGTAAVVRDMVAIHDALEGPEKPINYWGMSYGTVVGMYFVNMFPDRVGRVVLDSVVDPRLWANRPTYEFLRNTIESTDETFNGFAEACAKAGPSKCAIAQQNSTAASIRQWTRDLLDAVYDYRREAGASALFTSADIRNEIHTKLYNPQKWSNLSSGLYAVKETLDNPTAANLTQAKRWLSETFSPTDLISRAELNNSSGIPAYGYELEAVSCSDAQDGDVTTKDVFDAIVNVTQNFSPMFGPVGFPRFARPLCHYWPRAVERYTGPWNRTLSNTILVIGITADPITPYSNAKWVADTLGDSAVLIKQGGYGHPSINMPSNCTKTVLQKYFGSNELPKKNKFCETSYELFSEAATPENIQ